MKEFPPIRMLSATKDPLYDEGIRFSEKITDLEKDIKIIQYKNFCHGFLSFDVPGGLKVSVECINDSITCLKELLCK